MSNSSMFRFMLIIVICFCVSFNVCEALTVFPDDPVESNSARSLAMGSACIAVSDGKSSYLSNPATLVLIERSMITGGINLDQIAEEEYSYGELGLDNSQVYINPLRYQHLAITAKSFSASLGRSMLIDYFRKTENINEDSSSTFSSKGGLYSISASAAKSVTPEFSVGGSLNILDGKADIENTYSWETIDYNDSNWWDEDYTPQTKRNSETTTVEQTESGYNFSVGALYNLNEQVNIGAVYNTSAEVTLKTKKTTTEDGNTDILDTEKFKWTYPTSMGFGLSYKSGQFLVVGEIHRVNWSEYKHGKVGESLTRPEYVNLTTYHVGIEYMTSADASDPIFLRCGFNTSPFHFLREVSSDETSGYFLTAGIGMNLNDIKIDIGGRIGKKTYSDFSSEDEYEASIKSVIGNLSYKFDMSSFAKQN
ncbi:hypothetical protein GF312_01085 [Candidatus Poribacteria bacterium]|nr:hypothetical protein [Candidatus Poribacteria bacterium]